jgi:hypothetical protein
VIQNQEIDSKIISNLKSFDWDFIIDFALNHVSNIKGNQYNFLRGSLIESIVNEQDEQLEFVGENHKDFKWHRFNVTVECKSLLNNTMYDKRGKLKDNFSVKLCSLRSKRKIKPEEICDIILVIMKDGSFIIPKNVAVHNTVQKDKQIDIVIGSNHIIEISGPKNLTKVSQKVDINEMVQSFQKMLIDKARQNFNRRKKLGV